MPRATQDQIRPVILKAIQDAGKPITVGELFLITRINHSMINKILRKLQDDGIVDHALQPTRTIIYSGQEIQHESMHWWLTPKSNRTTTRKKS